MMIYIPVFDFTYYDLFNSESVDHRKASSTSPSRGLPNQDYNYIHTYGTHGIFDVPELVEDIPKYSVFL